MLGQESQFLANMKISKTMLIPWVFYAQGVTLARVL